MKLGFDRHKITDYVFAFVLILIPFLLILTVNYQVTHGSYSLVNMMSLIMGASFSEITMALAYVTYKLNRNNHRLSLFDKRYKIYDALKSLLESIVEARLSEETYSVFKKKRMEAEFLFERDILDYLSEIESKIKEWEEWQAKREFEQEQKQEKREKLDSLFAYLKEESVECDKKFMRYLSFQKL